MWDFEIFDVKINFYKLRVGIACCGVKTILDSFSDHAVQNGTAMVLESPLTYNMAARKDKIVDYVSFHVLFYVT